ncbi:hypothetical protein [Natronoglomus mannanivorans]|uniref:Uncharacterized protein n=1 Tax=Natronoglomus mannanivorans TaxID=2979990 RepID=A0AAP2Z1Q2_9EURY|nr:hypothetical protein [Halobacteria archaeon AArc-xg1-1]
MDSTDERFDERAKRFLSRTPGDHGKDQTVEFIAEMYRIESELIDLEKRVDGISPSIVGRGVQSVSTDLLDVSDDLYRFQKAVSSPEDHLHAVLGIEQGEVDSGAVSEILTQLGWEWFPRELDRLYSTQDRVIRKVDAKKQRVLTIVVARNNCSLLE